jgi:2-hydroxy-3-keto-5-methylthiopentenyl-1-phosphate phosphatase
VSSWSILCDFDGTIAVEDVTDVILERFARPGWRAIEDKWRDGQLSSRLCMQQQVSLLDMSLEELDEAIDDIRIDPAFPAFVHAVQRTGWSICVVSDGLDYAIRRILSQYGLESLPIYANHLAQTGTRSWRLDSPWAASGCSVDSGTCKCARARLVSTAQQRTLLVGDGASDFCAAEHVDFVFAKHRLIEHCRAHNLHHVPIVGFDDAIHFLPALKHSSEKIHQSALQSLELRPHA